MNDSNIKKRETELDLLRIISSFAVILSHSGSANQTSDLPIGITGFLISIVVWHVPCFVMISGRFWLDPNREINKEKIVKGIKKLLYAFLFWNIIYQTVNVIEGKTFGLNWKGFILDSGALLGPFHFWFLWMIVGLYLITPFLRKITQEKELMEYYIVLFLIVGFFNSFGEYIPYVGGIARSFWTLMDNREADIKFVLGFSGYYILGYYLYKYPLKKKYELFLYVIGGTLLIGSSIYRCYLGSLNDWQKNMYNFVSPSVVIFSASIFCFFVKRVSKIKFSNKTLKIIDKLQELSFGIFLVHLLVVESLMHSPFFYSSLLSEPIMRIIRTIITFVLSALITQVLRKIPRIGKKIT